MQFKNMGEILDFAMEKEKEAVEFYRFLSKKKSLSGSKEMFADFAREEQKHFDMLSKIKSGQTDKAVSEYRFKWIPDIKRSNYVVETAYQKGMGYNEILMLAMKREEKALALYNNLLKKAETDAAKKVFKILCQEEAKHKLALETLYDDYMAKMGD
ncbi:MAG: rubrerythrin [Desulfobacterales bacterium CG23_combo_of_CG06-09_8_20_14_all_52_9]|nr:MAG: rubrerythrin [Desulfobacterales bacterium CG23_combo_of_CG06-09_8_20_14_all_52_9]